MDVILLERIESLGKMGDTVKVKPGYARNYLLPQKKALRATDENRAYFERKRVELEAINQKAREEAETKAKDIDGRTVTLLRSAGESGQLYGSVSARDVADALLADGVKVHRNQIPVDKPIKTLGIFAVRVFLHPEVIVSVRLNIARTADEAQMQLERGGMVTSEMVLAEEEQAEANERAAAQAEADYAAVEEDEQRDAG